KMSRIQQNMKQVTLAKGICSTSYLSKIENNQTIPSEDVLQLLLERLNLDYEDLSTEQEMEFLSELYSHYKVAILERNKEEITRNLKSYSDKNFLFKDEKNFYTYNLYLLRLYLITVPTGNICISLISALTQMEENFDVRQKFIFHLNIGIFQFIQRDFKKAILSFEISLHLLATFPMEDWELADFYNALSLSYLSEDHILNAIEFATKSLTLYKDNLLFARAFDCYIVIGIAYKRNLNFKNAEENFLLARKIATNFKLTKYNEIIYHNLGSLYAIQGNSNKAIDYFEESLKYSSNAENTLLTIYSISKEYSKQNDKTMVNQWTDKGLDYISTLDQSEYMAYYYHFHIFKLNQQQDMEFEDILLSAIEYFESKQDFHYVHKYSILLGNKYSEIRKYKNSALSLQKAISFLYKIKSINYWEDL
ncbi:helix-turn-helix domain-containing protein, partial [Paenisporosarcina sp.]|uniref:helix-turn-helix domain-containing protein n=1 Tax=Paenisporosarcina sp. TaxID=1932001 RepID=UPI003C755C4C